MATASDRGWTVNPATVRVPCPGIPLNLHPAVAPLFAELIRRVDAVKGTGFMQSSGGKNVRPVRGYEERYARTKSDELLSNHSWGLAADFRAGTNPMSSVLVTDMPANIRQIAAACGLQWGGNYSGRKDPMHFEFIGTPADARAAVARLTPPPPSATPDFLEALVAQLTDDEKNRFMTFVDNYNRTWNVEQTSKAPGHEGEKVWLADGLMWTEGNTSRAAAASEQLLTEQRKTNELLAKLVVAQGGKP